MFNVGSRIFQRPVKVATEPSRRTMRYLNDIPLHRRNLSGIDFSKAPDIFAGIKVFEGIDPRVLFKNKKFFSFSSILLQRGCMHQCSHCGAESSRRIKMMPWDNFTQIIDGIGALKERLGFNPFGFLVPDGSSRTYLYHDSDPMIYISKGKDGVVRNIYDAAKYLVDKTGNKTGVQTAGWLSEHSQRAAEQLSQDSSALGSFGLSIHPFHKYMESSIQSDMAGDTQGASKWRNMYTDMMANAVRTVDKVKNSVKYSGITLEYVMSYKKLADERKRQYYSREASEKLLDEIFEKAQVKREGIDIQHRSINSFGRTATDTSLIEDQQIDHLRHREYDSKMIDVDGTILSNPFNVTNVFFAPRPVLNSDGTPMKLNFCGFKKLSKTA